MEREKKQPFRPIGVFIIFAMFMLLACGINLPSQEQVQGGLATAQAVGQRASELATQAAPTLQAAVENAQALATNAAPTLQAVQTRAVAFATEGAPTVNAGLEQLATAAAGARAAGGNAQATLQAAGIDGDYLRTRLASLRPDENGDVYATFTETEINLVLQARQLAAQENGETVAAQGVAVRFTDGLVIVTGQVRLPVEGFLTMIMQPIVETGKLRFNVVSADLDGRDVPPLLLSTVEGTLNGTINGAVDAIPGGVVLKEVVVSQGTMTLVAGR